MADNSKPLADRIALSPAPRAASARRSRWSWRRPARMWWRSRAPSAAWKSSTTRSRRPAARATLVPLDMKDMDGIARLALALHERYGRLDVMVGNAGILGPLSPLGHVEPKDWDNLFAVNVTANWQLIRTMDPLLQRPRRRPRGVPHVGR